MQMAGNGWSGVARRKRLAHSASLPIREDHGVQDQPDHHHAQVEGTPAFLSGWGAPARATIAGHKSRGRAVWRPRFGWLFRGQSRSVNLQFWHWLPAKPSTPSLTSAGLALPKPTSRGIAKEKQDRPGY